MHRCKCHSQITSYHCANIQHDLFPYMIHSFGPWVPGNWSAKRLRWQLPPEERRLSGWPSKDLICEPFYLQTLLREVHTMSSVRKPFHDSFLYRNNRGVWHGFVPIFQSTMTHRLVHNVFLCSHTLLPGAESRSYSVNLRGRISTTRCLFWEGNRWVLLHKSPVENGTTELSQDWSRYGHREVHHLAERLHAYFCTTEEKQKYSLKIPSWSMIKSGSVLITYLKILYYMTTVTEL